ncbi:MAG: GxxExxY protein [Planctomycetaceae bacterium]
MSDDDLSHEIIGAAIEVHRTLGPGLLESVYEESLYYELQCREILVLDDRLKCQSPTKAASSMDACVSIFSWKIVASWNVSPLSKTTPYFELSV